LRARWLGGMLRVWEWAGNMEAVEMRVTRRIGRIWAELSCWHVGVGWARKGSHVVGMLEINGF